MAEDKETKVEEKKVVKKLDDVKDSPENKAALAAHAGVPSEEGKDGEQESEGGEFEEEAFGQGAEADELGAVLDCVEEVWEGEEDSSFQDYAC